MPESQRKTENFAQLDAFDSNQTPSRLSKVIFFVVCATLIFAVVAFGAVDFWALGVLSAIAGFISILWLAEAWRIKEFRGNFNQLQIPLLGLIFIGAVQLLPLRSADVPSAVLPTAAVSSLSLAPYSTRLAIIQLVVYFVFFSAAYTFINHRSRLRKIVVTIIVFASMMAFYGILQRLANLEEIYGLRSPGFAFAFASFINQHHFAALMEMTIGITLALFFGGATKNNKRFFLIVAVVIMGMAIVFTSSRGGMLSLFGVIGFITAANILQKPTRQADSEVETVTAFRRNFALIGGGLTLILVLFGFVLLLGGDESLLRGIGLGNQTDVSNGRTHFWSIALQIFRDHPITGAGLDSFGIVFTRYDTWNGTLRVEQAHNDYLQILADAGILGFACVAAFIFLLFKQGLRTVVEAADPFRRAVAIGALAGCCGILIHSFFDFPLRTPANALFFLTLSVLATASIHHPKLSKRRRRSRLDSSADEPDGRDVDER